MKIKVNRIYKGETYTIGKMYLNGEYFCDTLEDAVRPVKIPNETAIPAGTYKVEVTYSPKFKRDLPLLIDVPDYTGIRIHNGSNKDHTSGCILVGFNKTKGQLTDSYIMSKLLTMRLKSLSEPIEIEIG